MNLQVPHSSSLTIQEAARRALGKSPAPVSAPQDSARVAELEKQVASLKAELKQSGVDNLQIQPLKRGIAETARAAGGGLVGGTVAGTLAGVISGPMLGIGVKGGMSGNAAGGVFFGTVIGAVAANMTDDPAKAAIGGGLVSGCLNAAFVGALGGNSLAGAIAGAAVGAGSAYLGTRLAHH